MPNVRITKEQVQEAAAKGRQTSDIVGIQDLVASLHPLVDDNAIFELSYRRDPEIRVLAFKMAHAIVPRPTNHAELLFSTMQFMHMADMLEAMLRLAYIMAIYDERESNEQRNQPSETGTVEQPVESSPPEAG